MCTRDDLHVLLVARGEVALGAGDDAPQVSLKAGGRRHKLAVDTLEERRELHRRARRYTLLEGETLWSGRIHGRRPHAEALVGA